MPCLVTLQRRDFFLHCLFPSSVSKSSSKRLWFTGFSCQTREPILGNIFVIDSVNNSLLQPGSCRTDSRRGSHRRSGHLRRISRSGSRGRSWRADSARSRRRLGTRRGDQAHVAVRRGCRTVGGDRGNGGPRRGPGSGERHAEPAGWLGRHARGEAGKPGPAGRADPEANLGAAGEMSTAGTWMDPEADCTVEGGDPEEDPPGDSVHIKCCTVAPF
jgi:hypothetical protein